MLSCQDDGLASHDAKAPSPFWPIRTRTRMFRDPCALAHPAGRALPPRSEGAPDQQRLSWRFASLFMIRQQSFVYVTPLHPQTGIQSWSHAKKTLTHFPRPPGVQVPGVGSHHSSLPQVMPSGPPHRCPTPAAVALPIVHVKAAAAMASMRNLCGIRSSRCLHECVTRRPDRSWALSGLLAPRPTGTVHYASAPACRESASAGMFLCFPGFDAQAIVRIGFAVAAADGLDDLHRTEFRNLHAMSAGTWSAVARRGVAPLPRTAGDGERAAAPLADSGRVGVGDAPRQGGSADGGEHQNSVEHSILPLVRTAVNAVGASCVEVQHPFME
jgi:hypothetical protein